MIITYLKSKDGDVILGQVHYEDVLNIEFNIRDIQSEINKIYSFGLINEYQRNYHLDYKPADSSLLEKKY